MFDINDPEKTILGITEEDITKSFLLNVFAVDAATNKPLMDSRTRIKIEDSLVPADSILRKFKNWKDIVGTETNAGRIVFNVFIGSTKGTINGIENSHLATILEYINKPTTAGVIGGLNRVISDAYVDKYILSDIVKDFIDRMQWMGYTTAIYSIPSLDIKTIHPSEKVKKKRDQMLRDNREVIESNDVMAFGKLENEMIDFAKKDLEEIGATGKMIYDSGFNGSWNNNFKVNSIFRGIAPKSDDPTSFSIVTSNLMDGVAKEDIAPHADLAVLGAAGRAVDTQKGGYLTKLFNAAFSGIIADKPDSDCGTTKTINVELTGDNKREYRYRYIYDKNELVCLTPALLEKYVGKTVKMRTPLLCQNKHYCHHCLGDMFYRLGVKNIGLHVSRISARIMNLSMKSFHDLSVQGKEFDIFDHIEDINSK